MEDILRDVYEDKISNINTLGILHIEHNYERITNSRAI